MTLTDTVPTEDSIHDPDQSWQGITFVLFRQTADGLKRVCLSLTLTATTPSLFCLDRLPTAPTRDSIHDPNCYDYTQRCKYLLQRSHERCWFFDDEDFKYSTTRTRTSTISSTLMVIRMMAPLRYPRQQIRQLYFDVVDDTEENHDVWSSSISSVTTASTSLIALRRRRRDQAHVLRLAVESGAPIQEKT